MTKKTNGQSKGGRKELEEDQALSYVLRCRVNKAEYDKCQASFSASGYKNLSDYLRVRLTRTEKLYVSNPKEFIETMSKINLEISRIGNNINQLARFANVCLKSNTVKPVVLQTYNQVMTDYLKTRKELTAAIKAFCSKATF